MSGMIVMRVAQRGDGADVADAQYDGREFSTTSRHGSTMALARQLVAAGVPDGPWRAIGMAGRLRFSGPSLHRLARLTVEDGDGGAPRIRKWAARKNVPNGPARTLARGFTALAGADALAFAGLPE